MKLIKMEVSGFKSFSDKVIIDFSKEGITTFIGPNGCGKSNIVDALRWAMGEQSVKNLRGGAMADVIFSGTQNRPKSGFCQVSLVFANQQYSSKIKYQDLDEVLVTRRLYQDGQSEYLINKQRCRLADVKDLFIDTGLGANSGYSIVEQGSIGAIITNRALDRRQLIEEAAGIVKFKIKKKEAEKKLAATKQNLLRIEDVLTEVKKQEQDLSVQAKEAKKYFELKNKVELLENFIQAKQWFVANNDEKNLRQTLAKSQSEIADLKINTQALESNIAAISAEITGLEQTIEEMRSQLESETAQRQSITSEIKLKEQQKKDALKWQKKDALDTANYEKSLNRLNEDLTKAKVQISKAEVDKALIHKTLQGYQAEINLINDSLSSKAADLSKLNKQKSELLTTKNRTEALLESSNEEKQAFAIAEKKKDISNTTDKLKLLNEKIASLKTKQKLCFNNIAKQTDKISSTNHQTTLAAARIKELSKRSVLLEDALATKTAAKQKLQLQYDMLNKKLMSASSFLQKLSKDAELKKTLGFLGLLNDFLVVKDTKDDFETQAKNFYLNCLYSFFHLAIFKSQSALPALIDACKNYGVNELKFTFLDVVPEALTNVNLPNYITFNLPKANRLLNQLLSNDKHILPSHIKVLGSSSEFFSEQLGVFVYSKDLATNNQQQKSKFVSEISTLDSWLLTKQATHKKLKQQLQHINESNTLAKVKLDELKEELSTFNADLRVDESMLKRLEYEKEETASLITKHKEELKKLAESKAESGNLRASYHAKLNELSELLEDKISLIKKLAFEEASAKSLREEKLQKLHEAKINLNNTENEIKSHAQLVVMVNHQISEIKKERAKINNTQDGNQTMPQIYEDEILNLNQLLVKSEACIKELSIKLNDKRQNHMELKSEIFEQEKTLKDKSNHITQIEAKNNLLSAKLEQLNLEKDKITADLFEFKQLKPEEVLRNFDYENFDLKTEYNRLKSFKISLAGMDEVNLSAQGDYEKIFSRLSFLEEQNTDLLNSVDLLEQSITKINQNSKRMFEEAFYAINEKFKNVFPVLFGGGSAYLELIDNKNVLESGLEIKVCPPGKSLKNINLLSGGEKALTAAALIVAIFLYKPSPFCVLDEVDAPLDVNNVKRFCTMIKSLTPRSQFIMITHNPKSMEIADYIYGVTMEEAGVSKVVSVDLNNINLKKQFKKALP